MSWESCQGDVWAWTLDGRYCVNLSAWERVLRNAVGPEPEGPEALAERITPEAKAQHGTIIA